MLKIKHFYESFTFETVFAKAPFFSNVDDRQKCIKTNAFSDKCISVDGVWGGRVGGTPTLRYKLYIISLYMGMCRCEGYGFQAV